MGSFRPLLVACSLLVCAALLLRARYAPPPALDAHAADSEFSARRAIAALARVLGDQAAHPTGSPANERVRERLTRELQELGLSVEDRAGLSCGGFGFCATVHNLLCRLPGSDPMHNAGVLMLAAHHDSVVAGPGAADDGAGIATLLEIARVLRGAPTRHAVLLLFTDGEELGGLGARLFAKSLKTPTGIAAVINVEARGTTGPSILFETSEPNYELIARYAANVRRPLSNSAAYSVYKMLPNDTDLTVFRERGLAGYNFAFIGGAERYHTAIDDLAHLDPASVQSSGAAALTLLRSLDARPPQATRENAVWFDLFGLTLVRWEERGNYLLWNLAGVGLFVGLFLSLRRKLLAGAHVALAFARLVLVIALSVIFGFLLLAAIGNAAPANWIASPGWLELTCLFVVLSAIALSAGLIPNHDDALAGVYAQGIGWWLLAVVTTERAPGTAYLFALPALVCAGCAGVATVPGKHAGSKWMSVALAVLTAVLWFPALYFLYDSIGINLPFVETAALALVLSPLAALIPPLPRRRFALAGALGAAALVSLLAARFVPPFSPDAPQRESLAYHLDADTGRARFLVDANGGQISEALRKAGSLAPHEVDPYPWFGGWGRKTLAGPAPAVTLEPPSAELLEDSITGSERYLKLHIRSPRNALAVSLGWQGNVTSARLAGLALNPWRQGNAQVVSLCGDTAAGADVELTLPAGARLEALVFDHAMDLPAVAAPLRAARGRLGTPSQSGDVTVVSRAVRL